MAATLSRLFVGFAVFVAWMCVTATAVALTPERTRGDVKPKASGVAFQRPNASTPIDPPTTTTVRRPEATTSTTHAPPSTTTTSTTEAPVAAPIQAPVIVAAQIDIGTCAEWVAAAGIVDTASAFELIARESGCDPYIYNRAGSGACWIPQALPCSKLSSVCNAGDGFCQVAWMNTYVLARYGTWANALAFQKRNGWY